MKSFGLIAQQVRNYYPEVVKISGSGFYFVEYHKLNAVLVEAIKEQQVFIDEINNDLKFIEEKLING